MNELLEGFFEECEELLEVLSDGLDAMAAGTVDEDTINAVFRSVHSIKGSLTVCKKRMKWIRV